MLTQIFDTVMTVVTPTLYKCMHRSRGGGQGVWTPPENQKGTGFLSNTGIEVIKLEFILRLKIKRNDWLLADTCPQAASNCALF